MGIEYALVSDAARVGYDLGKGPWDDDFVKACRKDAEGLALIIYLEREWDVSADCRENGCIDEVVHEIVAFITKYPDWRVVNDAQDDLTVADEEMWHQLVNVEGDDPNDEDFPIYRQVGTRYRDHALGPADDGVEEDPEAAAALDAMRPQIDDLLNDFASTFGTKHGLAALARAKPSDVARALGQTMSLIDEVRKRTSNPSDRVSAHIRFEAAIPPGETVEVRAHEHAFVRCPGTMGLVPTAEIEAFRGSLISRNGDVANDLWCGLVVTAIEIDGRNELASQVPVTFFPPVGEAAHEGSGPIWSTADPTKIVFKVKYSGSAARSATTFTGACGPLPRRSMSWTAVNTCAISPTLLVTSSSRVHRACCSMNATASTLTRRGATARSATPTGCSTRSSSPERKRGSVACVPTTRATVPDRSRRSDPIVCRGTASTTPYMSGRADFESVTSTGTSSNTQQQPSAASTRSTCRTSISWRAQVSASPPDAWFHYSLLSPPTTNPRMRPSTSRRSRSCAGLR